MKTTQATATATPWRVEQYNPKEGESGITVRDADGNDLAQTFCGSNPLARAQANARLIVEAVNQHDALLAVAGAAKLCNEWNDGRPINGEDAFEMLTKALAALEAVRKGGM